MHLRTSAVRQQQQIVLVTDCIAKNTTISIAKRSSLAVMETLDGSYKGMMRIIFVPVSLPFVETFVSFVVKLTVPFVVKI